LAFEVASIILPSLMIKRFCRSSRRLFSAVLIAGIGAHEKIEEKDKAGWGCAVFGRAGCRLVYGV